MKAIPAARAGALLLALLGVASAASEGGDAKARQYYYKDILSPFFALDAGAGLYRPQRPDTSAKPFAAAKPPGALRVFVVGGSIAEEHMNHPRNLSEALAAALPRRTVEIVAVGMPGYDSFRERMIVKEVAGYSPDLIVLFTGNNESLPHRPVPAWKLALMERMESRGMRKPPVVYPAWDEAALTSAFESNVRWMISAARKRGARTLVVLPPRNYRDAIVRTSSEASDPRFLRGWFEYARGDCLAAGSAWSGGRGPWTNFYRGRCAERLGRPEEAARLYAAAADTGVWQACPPRCRELLRRVALEEGAMIADVDAAFRAESSGRAPGLETFVDTMHWHADRNARVSLTLLEALVGWKELAWDKGEMDALARRWLSAERPPDDDRTSVTFRSAFRELSMGTFDLNWLAIIYLEHVHAARPDWLKKIGESVELRKKEVERQGREWGAPAPDAARFHWHYGEVLLRRGSRAEARRHFEEALRLRPALHGVWLSLALASALDGRPDAARLELAKAGGSPQADALAGALGLSGL